MGAGGGGRSVTADYYTVKKDGRIVAECEDANAAFTWLLRHQGQSVHYATTYEGYAIVPVVRV